MPNSDGTGPRGFRSVGKGLGPCGQGLKRCFNQGRFQGRRFLKSTEEKDLLTEEKDFLEKELNAVNERLQNIKA